MEKVELRECPFCGEEVRFLKSWGYGGETGELYVECPRCMIRTAGARIHRATVDQTEDLIMYREALVWNQRRRKKKES